MNYLTKIICTLISLNALTSMCAEQQDMSIAEKLLSAIGQSKPVTLFRKNVHAPVINALLSPYLGIKEANQEYQELAREAQLTLGIPEEDHVSIKQRIAVSHFIPPTKYVATTADTIYINENELRQLPEDIRHTSMLHEAAHVKYNDSSMQCLYRIGIFGSTMALFARIYKKPLVKKYQGLVIYPIAATSYAACYAVDTKFVQFAERRADTAAFYATRCASCVDNYDHHFGKRDEDGVYLPHHETNKIARELEQKQLYCTTHKPL